MDFPFEQISFGGVAHADFIKGFDYTYVGSRPGEIARCVSRMGYKNGIIFFDEYEKVSQNAEIVSTLLHITDFSQNNMFRDNYFSDLIIDLSSIWFIYSMNELPTDKALRDRVYAIHVSGYSEKEKVRIVADYLLPKVLQNIQLSKSDIILSDDVVQYLVQRVSHGEKGIRTLEKAIRDVVNKISFLHTNQQEIPCSFMIPSSSFPLCYPVSITRDMIDRLLKDFDINDAPLQMYI
jgi:ATP-dependent Lon protease